MSGTVLTDLFDRANTTSGIGTTDDGIATWTTWLGTAGINNHQGYFTATAGTPDYAVATLPGLADGFVQVDVTAGVDLCGIVFRLQDANNFLGVEFDAGNVRLFQYAAGVYSSITTAGSTNPPATLRVDFSSTTVQVSVNGTNRITRTVTFLSTATQHGIGVFASSALGVRFDNFSTSRKKPGWVVGRIPIGGPGSRLTLGPWFGEISVGLASMNSGYASCYADNGGMSVGSYDHPFGAADGGVVGPGASYSAVGHYPGTTAPVACAWNNGKVAEGSFNISTSWLNTAAASVGCDPATLDHWIVRAFPGLTNTVAGPYSTGAYRQVEQDPFGSITVKDLRNDPDPDSFMASLQARVFLLSNSATFSSSNTDATNSTVLANAPLTGATQGFLSVHGYYTSILTAITAGTHLGDVAVGSAAPAGSVFSVADQSGGSGHLFTFAVAHGSVIDYADTTPAMAFPDWTATSVCTNTPDTVFRRHMYELPSLNIAPVFNN